ncbi:Aste57867_340 [Aphanomyces stellatus]|uniref:Aste57867_340 protein n=1 Tax=Aphanomyces stellatus TaxID=120398 RepID=A0A485K5H2_9STRA|nr:hypothetical protein As57867_000340 [Aphanomyces stellatus]VFT77566.1 Aste57867_340 [Aphanomyces stellatus]
MSALEKNLGTPDGAGRGAARGEFGVDSGSDPTRFMEILRKRRYHDDEDQEENPAAVLKKRAVIVDGHGHHGYAHNGIPDYTMPLPKINPVVLVLKKRPLEAAPENNATPQPNPASSTPNAMLQSEKLQSVIRGLVHFSQCPDGCTNKLCQSTTAFVTKVRNHLKTQPVAHDRASCGACKLWTMIVDEHRKDCLDPHCSIPLCKRSLYM